MSAPQTPLYPVDRIPVRKVRAEFADKTAELLTYVAVDHVPGMNTATTFCNTKVTEAESAKNAAQAAATNAGTSATEANEYAQVAAALANFEGRWIDQAGAKTVPLSVHHEGKYWTLLFDVGNVLAEEPGVSSAWEEVQVLQVLRTPTPIAPLSGATGETPLPELSATAYASIYSSITRATRNFQVDLATGDFTTPVYDADENADAHTVTDQLDLNTAHKWRCRDEGSGGEVSQWSAVQQFSTGDISVAQPTLNVEGSPTEVPEQPTLETGAFDTIPTGQDTHLNTDWQILDDQLDVVWESLADASNMISIEVPAGELLEDTAYTFRVRHRGTTYGESAWDSVVATTIETFDEYKDEHIGEAREGGFFAGRMNPDGGNIRYALITAPKASGESSSAKWKADTTTTPGTLALAASGYTWAHWDGERNTRICTLNATTHAAADYADGLTIATHTDWYLPGADELELQYRNFKPDTTANNTTSMPLHDQTNGFNPNSEPRKPGYTAGDPPQTVLTAYQTSGAESFEAAGYWSSSEVSATSAWSQNFSGGYQASNADKTGAYRVRAVRRSILYPFSSLWFGDLVSDQGGYWGGNVWDGVRTTVLGDTMTSTTSLEVGTGTKALEVAGSDDLTPTLWVGRKLRFVATGKTRATAAWMTGTITDINTSTRVVTITCTHVLGSGTHTAWALVGGQALIVAPKAWGDVGTFTWKDEQTAGPVETQTLTNGPAATLAMINAGTSTVYPAAHQIAAMNAFDSGAGRGGFNDWYMPSRDELHTIGYTLCPTAAGWTRDTARTADVTYSHDGNINDSSFTEQTNWHADPIVAVSAFVPQTHKDLFKVGGTECFEATHYWSSSENSASSAWIQYFSVGHQGNLTKSDACRVRAVRRVAI